MVRQNKTIKHIERACRSLEEFFGTILVREIKPTMVERYQGHGTEGNSRHGRPRSMASVNREITVLKHMFNLAVREEPTDKNPCWKIKMLAENNARNRILSPEELERLISNLPNHAAQIIQFAYLTGMRAGEIFHLTWNKVNLKQRASRLEAGDTKTSEPRVIYLNNEVLGILHEAGRVRGLGHNRVFTYKGRPSMSIRTAFLKSCSRGGIENFRFHDLRHTSNPDNSPDNKELGGTGFPACAKNTLLFRVI